MKPTARMPEIRDLRPGAAVRRRGGLVLPTVLVLLLTVCLVVGLVARFSIRSMRLARRTLDVERAFVCAEGGLGYGVMQVKSILKAEKVAGIRAKYQTITAPASPDPGFELRVKVVLGAATDTHGTIDTASQAVTVFAGARSLESGVACALQQVISLDGVSLSDYAVFYDGDFEACPGNGNGLRYTGKVHTNGDIFVTKKAKFERNLTCHGAFHNLRKNTRTDDFTDTSNRRRVYIRYGDDAALSAEEKDATGDSGLKNTLKSGASLSATAEYYDSDLADNGWSTEGLLYYGKAIQTGADGVPRMDPPIGVDDDNHTLIEKPVPRSDTASYNSDTESQKFANRAALYLKVNADGSYVLYKQTGTPDNPIRTKIGDSDSMEKPQLSTWGVTDEYFDNGSAYGTHRKINYAKDGGNANTYIVENDGVFRTDDCFIDHRVWWIMKPVDIYLDKLLASGTAARNALDAIDASGGSGKIDKILYVEMPDTLDPVPTTWTDNGVPKTNAWVRPLPCVRIRNGADLKGSDLTIATEQPVYVEGNFNTGGSWWTDPASDVPNLPSAMIAADRVTLFSSEFQQYKGHDPYLGKNACKDGSGTGKEGTTAIGTDSAGNKVINEWDPERARQGQWQPMGQMYLGAGGSKRWIRDTPSGKRTPAAGQTTINAVIMSGIYPSVDAQDLLKDNITPNSDWYYSGGLENILRMDEIWTDALLYFNGSVICLWNSEKPDYRWMTYAKSTKYPGGSELLGNQVWAPPKAEKQWTYVRMTPPGMPNFYAAAESAWARIPWSSVDWGDGG